MKTSQTGLDLIKKFEGFSPKVYICPAGYPTIGYGHLVRAGEAYGTIDEAQATVLLQHDVESAERAVKRLCPTLDKQNRFDAIVSFTYNLGAGALQRSTLRQKINRGEHSSVPAELRKWVWAGGRKLPGLVARRAAEGAMY